jgi:homopolymeric O-antigen transport system ATP-binding protein
MSSEPVIIIEELSKRYRIGTTTDRNPSLREAVTRAVTSPISRLRRGITHPKASELWALKDLSMEINRGDVVGFIGRNGAGKTTLLKILSRITDPTEGRAELRGRVGSLLEVGTGFHPDLTGRENIGLNGAILGMSRVEIRKRFDAIVDFSEMSAFLDTPVKRYSSGMSVRLAFAVAAHLEPEILIVDEVLAVGDAAFQQKCLNKMGEVAGAGRTVLFVSHNMAVVQALCDRGVFLDHGRVVADGSVDQVVSTYLRSLELSAAQDLLEREDRDPRGWRDVMLQEVSVISPDGRVLSTGRPAQFFFRLTGRAPGLSCTFVIYDDLGLPVATFDSSVGSTQDLPLASDNAFVCEIDELPLVPGQYRIDVTIKGAGEVQDGLEAAGRFQVEEGTMRGRPVPLENRFGRVFFPHRWQIPANGTRPAG